MKVTRLPIGEIIPADYNPRVDLQPHDPEYQALQRSIERWDNVEPLVWNERTKHLVGGHQRLKVLIARGDTEVDVSVVNLDENEERALSIALNKISGRWDDPKAFDLLRELDTQGFDIKLTGFDPEQLVQLARDIDKPLFTPELKPIVPESVVETSTVTERDIRQAAERQEERFAGTNKEIQDVTCPNCGHEFGLEV